MSPTSLCCCLAQDNQLMGGLAPVSCVRQTADGRRHMGADRLHTDGFKGLSAPHSLAISTGFSGHKCISYVESLTSLTRQGGTPRKQSHSVNNAPALCPHPLHRQITATRLSPSYHSTKHLARKSNSLQRFQGNPTSVAACCVSVLPCHHL